MCLIPIQFLLLSVSPVSYNSDNPGSVADSPAAKTDVTVSVPEPVPPIRKPDSDPDPE